MDTTYDRRAFLRRAGFTSAAVAAMVAGAPRPPARADESLAPFLHGIASGDPLHDRVILWTRVTPPAGHDGGSVSVAWEVASDLAMTAIVASGTATTDSSRDWTVKVEATGLAAATHHFYRFRALGTPSTVGRTRTTPAPGAPTGQLRFGMVSCSNWTGGFFHAYAHLAERQDLDAILHLGDYIYEYGNGEDRYGPESLAGTRDHQPPHEPITLADYRTRHANYKLDPDLRRLHQLHPFVTTWDDHETTDNSYRDGATNHDPATEGDWEVRKRAATQAYAEWMPIRSPFDDTLKIWRSSTWGDLAEVVVMDTRLQDRDIDAAGVLSQDPSAPLQGSLDDPARRMVSDEQRQFVFDRLTATPARWKLLAQQVMMIQWKAGGLPTMPAGAQDAPGIITPGGTPVNGDAWDGYPAERARFHAHFRDNAVGGIVVLTGDIHSSWAGELTEDPYDLATYNPTDGTGSLGVEYVCPSVTSSSFYKTLGYRYREESIAVEEATKADNPHIKYVEGDSHGFVILDITHDRAQAQFWYTHDVVTPEHEFWNGANWESIAGSNRVTEAVAAAPAGEDAPTPSAQPEPASPRTEPAPQPLPATGGGAIALGGAAVVAAAVLRRRGL